MNSCSTSTGRAGGFVLLEAVVALAIIGLASLALLQTRAQQIRVAAQAGELLSAQALAEDRLSTFRLLDYDGLSAPPDSLLEGVFLPPFDAFSWTAAVTPMDGEMDLFAIGVVVTGPNQVFPLNSLAHRSSGIVVGTGAGQGAGGVAGDQAGRGGRGGGDQAGRGARGGGDQAGRGGRGDAGQAGRGGRGGGDQAGRGGRGGGDQADRGGPDGAGQAGRGGRGGGDQAGRGGPSGGEPTGPRGEAGADVATPGQGDRRGGAA